MAQACLEDAYERVVPTVQRLLPVPSSTNASRAPAPRRRAGGVGW